MDKLRVLIIDDHAIVREGLRDFLKTQKDIDVVGEGQDGAEAISKTESLHPDLVLMDITMPGINGFEATRRIKELHPEVKILALTMHEDDEYFFKMLSAGASGYFVKGGSSAELLSAIQTVRQGEVFLYPTMTKRLLEDYLKHSDTGGNKDGREALTPREREILTLLAEGRTNQAVADVLKLSPTTVQTHRAHIMTKLGLHNHTELIKYALRQGLVTLEQ